MKASKDDVIDDRETTTLHRVKWTETVETEYEIVTEKLVWSGGAEKVIQHAPENSMYSTVYTDIDGYEILEIQEKPAYTEEIERTWETVEREKTKTAWVTEVPPGVEETGETKDVVEV